MKIIYVDESGNTSSSEKGSKFLCLTGMILDVEEKVRLELELRKIKAKYYFNPNIEFKSNFIRYASPDRQESSPLKMYDKDKYEEMNKELKDLLIGANIKLISIVMDKKEYWSQYPAQNPYEKAYEFLVERVQKELEEVNEYGLIIIDPREGGVDKSFIGDSTKNIHDKARFAGTDFVKTSKIVERLLYSSSDDTVGIQICDLYCYSIWHVCEYRKNIGEYDWYDNVSYLKLRRSHTGVIDGYGIKIFPPKTKNTLNIM